MIEFSTSLKLNEIYLVDSPFNENSKDIIFFLRGSNFGGGTAGKFRGNRQKQRHLFYANRGVVNFEREYQSLPPCTKILVIPQFSYMPDQILGKQ